MNLRQLLHKISRHLRKVMQLHTLITRRNNKRDMQVRERIFRCHSRWTSTASYTNSKSIHKQGCTMSSGESQASKCSWQEFCGSISITSTSIPSYLLKQLELTTVDKQECLLKLRMLISLDLRRPMQTSRSSAKRSHIQTCTISKF